MNFENKLITSATITGLSREFKIFIAFLMTKSKRNYTTMAVKVLS